MRKEDGFRWRRLVPFQVLSYLFLRALTTTIGMFPYRAAPRIGRILGSLVWLLDRKHRKIAAKNLERSGSVVAPDRIAGFVRRVYHHVGCGIAEMALFPRLIEAGRHARHVSMEGLPIVDQALRGGRGVIWVIGHLGNWEVAGLALALAGYPPKSLARPVENPWVDRYLNRFRTRTGQEIMPRDNALRSMIRVLQQNGILVVQVDQDARDLGIFVRFFGRPASTHRSPALLSLKYGAPIIPLDIFREGDVHRVLFSEPLLPEDFRDRPDPLKAMTQAYTERIEGFVRRHPDQWFWMHDRWKTAERAARVSAEALA
jgi:KDO2-lipid IV(A) lauroyltransferase